MNGRCRRRTRRAQRTYRLLVWLYPAAHRRAFGKEMVQTFGDHYGDAIEDRGDSRLRFWMAVLADAATSLLTEYVAEARARRRPAKAQRRRRPARRADKHRVPRRRVRASRRLRHPRRLGDRPVRVVIRTRHHRLEYRGRIAALIAFLALTSTSFGAIAAIGYLGIGILLAGLSLTVWLAHRLRLTRPVMAGPRGDGPAPPGGASVREPRRPLPISPAGSNALPMPNPEDPGQAVAVI